MHALIQCYIVLLQMHAAGNMTPSSRCLKPHFGQSLISDAQQYWHDQQINGVIGVCGTANCKAAPSSQASDNPYNII